MFQKHRTSHWTSDVYQVGGPVRVGRKTPDLYLSVIGRFFSNGKFVFEQVAKGYIMHVVESGEGTMEMDGSPYTVGTGDAFTFFPKRHFFYYDKPQTPWRYTWFQLDGIQARAAFAHVGVTEREPLMRGNVADALEPVFKEVVGVYAHADVPPSFAVAAALRLIDALAGTRASVQAPSLTGVAESARFLMDHRYMQTLSVEGIARQLGVSRSTLFRKFQEAYRVSPKDYLDSVRIDQARKLLRQSRSSIKEIAAACGYESSHYFSRAFRKRCGFSPMQWRQRRAETDSSSHRGLLKRPFGLESNTQNLKTVHSVWK